MVSRLSLEEAAKQEAVKGFTLDCANNGNLTELLY